MIKNILLPITALLFIFLHSNAYANMTFPAIAHQFMVSNVVPFYYSVLIAILILAIETYFIKKLLSCRLIQGFTLSFVVNLASSIVGLLLSGIILAISPLAARYLGYGNMRLGTYLGLMPGYILTIIIEGIFLLVIAHLMHKEVPRKAVFRISVFMNLFSYFVLLAGILISDILTKGEIFGI